MNRRAARLATFGAPRTLRTRLPLLTLAFAAGACGSDPASSGGSASDAGGDASVSGGGAGSGGNGGDDGGAGGGSGDSGTVSPGSDAGGTPQADAGGKAGSDGGSPGGDACGPCPTGFACTAGSHVCKSPGGIPHFGQVYVILMENQSESAIVGYAKAPYINSLLTNEAHTTSYSAVAHPSLPNYIALTSGSTQGIACDCRPGTASATCTAATCGLGDCNCTQKVDHLGNQLEAKSLSWRAYGEGMGTPCALNDKGKYAPRHVPFLYYDDVRTDATRCAAHVVDYAAFAGDMGKYNFSFIAPDLCDDMHDVCAPQNDSIAQGDDWLKVNVPKITGASTFGSDAVLFVVWDEGGTFGSQTVGLIALSPLAQPKHASSATFTHYSLLATIEEGLGLPKLGSAATATVMADLFQ